MQTARGVTYFVNTDAQHGWEIWRTDGTRKGTRLAFDLVPGAGSAQPVLDGIVGDRLIINATLEGRRGLFAVDLHPAGPVVPRLAFAPAAMPFSDIQLSNATAADRIDAIDLLTSGNTAL
jgi:ELWxxDGT repeat protein